MAAVIWEKPPLDTIKLNIDAARDGNGVIIMETIKKILIGD
jgi:hypothetical protein